MRATIVLAALSAIMPLAAAVPAADGADILAPRDSDDDTFAPILHTFNIPDLEQRALYQPETCTSSQKRCGLTCIPISEDCCALDPNAIHIYSCRAGTHCDKKSATGIIAKCKRGNAKNGAAQCAAVPAFAVGALALAVAKTF